jgi:hypothetical protein
MVCSGCQRELSATNKYCPDCGQPAQATDELSAKSSGSTFDLSPDFENFVPAKLVHTQPRPWIRYFAKHLDVFVISGPFMFLAGYIFPYSSALNNQFLASFLMIIVWVLVEPIVLAKSQTTLGKYLLGITLSKRDKTRITLAQAYSRTFGVYFSGLGLGIPIASLFTLSMSYDRLVKTNSTKWDSEGGFEVSHSEIPLWKGSLAAALLLGILGLSVLGAMVPDSAARPVSGQLSAAQEFDRATEADQFSMVFRANFPEDWRVIREQAIEDLNSSMTMEEIQARAHSRVRDITKSKVNLTASAPTADLILLVRAERDFIRSLQSSNPEACVEYGNVGLSGDEILDRDAIAAVQKSASQLIITTKAGQDSPTEHGQPTDADYDALVSALLNAGMTRADVSTLSEGNGTGTTSEKCSRAVGLYNALAVIPAERSARIYSMILREAP